MALSDSILDHAARVAGTPLYAYSGAALRQRVSDLKSALSDVDFVYSLKANPNVSIVGLLCRQGIGAEFCSGFEMEACLAAQVPPASMIFVGPAKSTAEIARAVDIGVKAIVAESIEELRLVADAASSRQTVQPVALRINPDFHTPGARLSMSGKATQFGLDSSDIAAALGFIAKNASLRLAGVHVYMGTRILDHAVIAKNTVNILALANEIIAKCGHPLDFVDVGGGFGIAYHDGETALDLDALGHAVAPVIASFKRANAQTRLIIELGRYLVAEAGVLLTSVRYVKKVKDRQFAICDGGSNIHTAAAQGASFRRNFPIRPVNPRQGALEEWHVSGPLCTPTDIIAQGARMPRLKPGDLLRIDKSGAYGLTASNVNFLSFASPAEVLWDEGQLSLIRERGTLKRYLAAQTPLPLTAPHDQPEYA